MQRSNIFAATHKDVLIRDVSGFENLFKIDKHGFEFSKSVWKSSTWSDGDVRKFYLPALLDWLRARFKCKDVHVYSYNFRCQDKRTTTEAWIGPFLRAHCDVSKDSLVSRLYLHLPKQADEVRKLHYRFIGVWQLLSEPPANCPLAICDASSVAPADLVPADIVFPHYCDEGYELRYNPSHRWYYKKNMTQDDMIAMKMFDSDESVTQCEWPIGASYGSPFADYWQSVLTLPF